MSGKVEKPVIKLNQNKRIYTIISNGKRFKVIMARDEFEKSGLKLAPPRSQR